MKVALLGPHPAATLPGDAPLAGGVDAVVAVLAPALAAQPNIDLSVVTAVAGLTQPIHREVSGYTVYSVPRPRGGRLTGQRAVQAHLRAQIAVLAPDIVHAHSAGIYAGAALGNNSPAVITLHGIIYREMQQAWPASSWPSRLRMLADARFERTVVRRAREIIAISPYVQNVFHSLTRARFHLVENPADSRFFTVAEPPPGRDRLLCVGRVISRKGILALIEAFALIARARPAATLVIAGETESAPQYVARCRARAAELAMTDRVRFAGSITPDAVRAEYAACDLVLLASEQETAPVTIAEAMAAGRAVVTTDVGGCAAMVEHGVTGRVVPPRAPAALAAAALELLAAPERLGQMGQAAHAAAERRFRLDVVVDATLAVYQEVLAYHSGGQPASKGIAT
jgi:glycosyltransferase involved in cell wall biosynthesis